ncbi:MAG: hypothetical protein IKB71_08660 [Lentisphaeria bacterium]|nr:hypothetical protein [Lentisphaeria bacterium]
MSWYYKYNEKEFGPMEERTVIAKLIDGEINSRTLVKDRFDGSYRMLLETDFNSILGSLTSRWRYNIGALKREFIYLMVSLAVWLIPLLSYLGGLFNTEVRSFLLHFGVMGVFGFFSFAGFFSSCYFAWVFAYRLWRAVPKSQYKITPGWRIMLTFIPFFRFGWNYCMWIPLATRLRALTNYSMKTGKVAAYFYCTGVIVLGCSIWSVAILPWSYLLLNGEMHEALWQNILGWLFIGLFVISFFITVISFIVMARKMEKAALSILRHRYAYNVCTQTRNSVFLESTLKKQRHYDKVHRWGHGLGIGGVLAGWPLILIGIPSLVLFIVGSCRYERTKSKIADMGYPSSVVQLYKYANLPDNALEDLRAVKNQSNAGQLDKIFGRSNLAIPADWSRTDCQIESADVEALLITGALLKSETEKSLKANDAKAFAANLAKYNKYLLWLLSSVVPEVNDCGLKIFNDFITIVNSDSAMKMSKDAAVELQLCKSSEILSALTAEMFVIKNLLHEMRFDRKSLPVPLSPESFWKHVYKYTPFVYFSKDAIWREILVIAAKIKTSGADKVTAKMIEKYSNSSFIIGDVGNEIELLKNYACCISELNKIAERVK